MGIYHKARGEMPASGWASERRVCYGKLTLEGRVAEAVGTVPLHGFPPRAVGVRGSRMRAVRAFPRLVCGAATDLGCHRRGSLRL